MPSVGVVTEWALGLTAGAVVLLLLAILVVRWNTTRRRRTQRRRSSQVLPLLLQVIDGEQVDRPRDRGMSSALSTAAADLTHKVRGAERNELAAWLTSHGYREAALAGMHSRRPSRRARSLELYLAATAGTDAQPVAALLRDPHPRVRAAAARALGDSGAASAVPDLVAAVASRRRTISPSTVAMAIVHAAPTNAAGLQHAWTSPDVAVRTMAADIAGYLGLADARPQIEAQLDPKDPEVHDHAVAALLRIGDPRSLPALTAARERVGRDGARAHTLAVVIESLRATDRGSTP